MTHVPIIPPYEPATGITQSPERPHQRRPAMGKLSDEEAKIEAAYLPKALAIVKAMWGHYSVQDIALEIFRQTDHWNTKPALVYALKRRLDRGQG